MCERGQFFVDFLRSSAECVRRSWPDVCQRIDFCPSPEGALRPMERPPFRPDYKKRMDETEIINDRIKRNVNQRTDEGNWNVFRLISEFLLKNFP